MKFNVSFPMNAQIYDVVFQKHKLKDKVEFLKILLEVSRYILTLSKVNSSPQPYNNGYIYLVNKKFSRLLFKSDKKCYSIGFPFRIITDDKGIIFNFVLNGIILLPIVITGALQILNGSDWNSTEILDFAVSIEEWQKKQLKDVNQQDFYRDDFWLFIRDLMMYDVGYVRYDISPEQFNPDNPTYHPVHHLHGGYCDDVSYRLGLNQAITIDELLDILDAETNCWMLNK